MSSGAQIVAPAAKEPYDALSLDIFDTALCRTWAQPSDVFSVLARRLRSQSLTDAAETSIRRLRLDVEKELRAQAGHGETTLIEIHRLFCERLGLAPELAARTAKLELDLELASIRPIAVTAARAKAASAGGQEVFYATDTYLCSDDIGALLNQAQAHEARVFASCELEASKKTGAMYSKIAETFPGLRIHHLGDKRRADVERAKEAGWSSEHFVAQKSTAMEDLLGLGRWSDPLAASAVSGAARAARLAASDEGGRRSQISQIGANIAGPIFTAFTGWCLATAQAQGVEKLLFLARDGQVFAQIAQKIQAGGVGFAYAYAYASRQALYLPAVFAVSDLAWGWLEAKMEGSSPETVLARFGLSGDRAAQLLAELGLSTVERLDKEDCQRLQQRLRQPDVSGEILQVAQGRRVVVADYFASQVGLARRVAIVDVGWKGRLQICLQAIFASDPRLATVALSGFYFSLTPNAPLLTLGQSTQFVDYSEVVNAPLIEVLASADHGTTTGYEVVDGQARPSFAPSDPESLAWGVRDLQTGAVSFAMNLADNVREAQIDWEQLLKELAPVALKAFQTFAAYPPQGLAGALGIVEHSDEVLHSTSREIGPKLSSLEIAALIVRGRSGARRAPFWVAGAIARSLGDGRRTRSLQSAWQLRKSLENMRPRLRAALKRKARA